MRHKPHEKQKIKRKPAAKADLLDIWEYVAADDIEQADRLLDAIEIQCQKLSRFPRLGRARDELLPSLRSFPVGNYVVFYRPSKDGIEIIRVLHGRRDVSGVPF